MSDPNLVAETFGIVYAKMRDDLSSFFWDAFTALNVNGISGDYVEFGSAGGTSLALAHDVVRRTPFARHLWAFDSFEGLPEPTGDLDVHPAFTPGFGQGGLDGFLAVCDENLIPRDAYTATPGFFEDSLGEDGTVQPTDIALAYIDCNMYSSTVTVLEFLAPRLKHGMILGFDDYFCWTQSQVSGERAALDEFLADHPEWNLLRFKDPTWGGASFVVERVDEQRPRRRP
ncbi:MAG: TylF/MycF/NovP-related O-methyltransferase [Aquihabitans sp.]